MRLLAILASLIAFVAVPSIASAADYFDMYPGKVIFDAICTDLYDTPAVTVTTDITTGANWDTYSEAINPDLNLNDDVQTSGTPDGWCDSQPWIIKGDFTFAADEDMFIGPIRYPTEGLYWNVDVDAVVTDWDARVYILTPWGAGNALDTWANIPVIAAAGINLWFWGPAPLDNWDNTTLLAAGSGPVPGATLYLFVGCDGIGDCDFSLATYSARRP